MNYGQARKQSNSDNHRRPQAAAPKAKAKGCINSRDAASLYGGINVVHYTTTNPKPIINRDERLMMRRIGNIEIGFGMIEKVYGHGYGGGAARRPSTNKKAAFDNQRLREIGMEGFDLIEKTFGHQKRVRQQGGPTMNSKQAAYYYGGLNIVSYYNTTTKPQGRWGRPFKP
ncbi:hypothetical protein G2W53_006278 [Senna tora]|uniref:Uncharacterized protein n=1 Tax=Senna tora TaxID=362788 RepID=A0A835CDU1_9FABA|nr:hypothetical protein G2W53_006278 [Senna tora]